MMVRGGSEAMAIGGDAVESTDRWFVLHTRSRQEKAVAVDLRVRQIHYFLPLVESVRYYGRRKATVQVPLFPGYVFLRGSIEQAYEADQTRRLARVIKVRDQQSLDQELKSLYRAQRCGGNLDPYPYLHKGIRVEVRAGPFKGIQGIVEDRTKYDRLILQVKALGQASSLEIDAALLEPVEPASACAVS